MISSCSIRIEKIANGYTVSMDDPEIVKANRARDMSKAGSKPWRDPNVKHAFKDDASVIAFISKNIGKMLPSGGDEYASSFDAAVAEDDDE